MPTHPVLPAILSERLAALGADLAVGNPPGPALTEALALLDLLEPASAPRADNAIAAAAHLYRRAPPAWPQRLVAGRSGDAQQLLATPGLERLFLFHRDGRLREAALRRMKGGLSSPFLFAAVACRLNDWAQPVRRAAADCAARCFPRTAPEIVARAGTALLARQASWGRWGDERGLLDQAFARVDVAACLAEQIIDDQTGPVATTLRHALRAATLDPYLERLASAARQPAVRAVALAALIAREATWPSGRRWQWIEKPAGKGRWLTTFAGRPLGVAPPLDLLIRRGAADRSAAVRRVALDGVIRGLIDPAVGRELAGRLADDHSRSVRERAAFIGKMQTAD